ncbi:MAG: secretin N-terminal domain-containing protein [Phycisphaerae bacterium]
MYSNKSSNNRTQIGKALYIYGFVLIVMVAIAVGGVQQNPIEADPNQSIVALDVDVSSAEDPPSVSESEPQAAEDVSTGAKIQSISFKKDWGIRDALQFLAARYQKNIVPSAKVDGLITITNLYDVTFEEALESILGYGFKYEQQGNFIKVYTAEEYKQIKEDPDRMVYQVFTLYYISAAEAKKLITPLLSSNSKVEVTSAALTDFPIGESISGGTGGGDATAMNDTIIVYDYPENLEQVIEVLRSVDIRPKQVLIEATVLSVTLTEDTQFGINWQTLLGNASGATDFIGKTKDFFNSTPATQQVQKLGGLTIGFSHDSIAAVIKAVEEVSDVTILANPKILAVNKQLGQVYIGKKLGYESQTTQTETSTTQKVDFLDTGTKLSFRPYIGNDGYVRMDIHPKDSSGDLKANNIPDETSAELVTNIIVKDGETIVVGGLFRDTIKANRTQVPVLGSLPIIGGLFRATADQAKREEVVILLTPHIIEEPSETEGQARADDVSRKRFGAKEAMQSASRARIVEDRYANAVKYYLEGDNGSAIWHLSIALKLRPTYLEALRLKERIIAETNPDDVDKMERIMLEVMDRQEASKWKRR